jgi:hypothetical protein
MITFDLECSCGHRFEGWFGSCEDFDNQQSSGQLACPLCNDFIVQKALSVPNIGRKGNQKAPVVPNPPVTGKTVGEVVNTPVLPAAIAELVHKLALAQTEMLKESQWVGGQFAETARAIHYGEEDNRLIHGEASHDEAEALAEEGVPIAPLPFPVIPPAAKN